jgi:hypothetical protein
LQQSVVSGSVVGIAVAAGCLFLGGWPFALISLVAFCWLSRDGFDTTTVLRTASFGIVWLALFQLTGDRRLFFPFTIQFALHTAFPRPPKLAGCAGTVAVFLMVRVLQGATFQVLLVETAVAVAVVAVSLAAYAKTSGGWVSRLAWAGFGSFLASLGLAL